MQHKIIKHCIRGWFQQVMGLQNEKGGPEEPPLFGAISDQINPLSFRSTEGGILINKM
jgi:hypothetical protein